MVGLEPKIKDWEVKKQVEAAALLGIEARTLRNYVRSGLMPPGRRAGRCTYYYGRDIKRCWRNYFNQYK